MRNIVFALVILSSSLVSRSLHAQDTRNGGVAPEPAFPTGTLCHHYYASQMTTYPDGPHGNPQPTYETVFDNTIQTDLDDCAQAASATGPTNVVELSIDSAGNNAFLIGRLTIPIGVTLVIDGGVTVFASKNPCIYQAKYSGGVYSSGYPDYCADGGTPATGNFCGQVTTSHYYCMPVITFAPNPTATASTVTSGIMGYGVIDGRGHDTLIGPNVDPAQATNYYGLYTYAAGLHPSQAGNQGSPDLIYGLQASNISLYKITLLDSPYYNVLWVGPKSGSTPAARFTAWGVKVLAPYDIQNTDGIDIRNLVKDVTISHSYISNGDDNVALASYGAPPAASLTQDITIDNVSTFSGFGLSVGNITMGAVANVLMQNITQRGLIKDDSSDFDQKTFGTGFHLKSSPDNGGVVSNVTYQNACIESVPSPIHITPYQGNSGPPPTPVPATFTNINIRNVTVEPNVKVSGGAITGVVNHFNMQGYDESHISTITMDNVYSFVDPDFTYITDQSIHNSEHDTFTLGTHGVTFSSGFLFSSITSPGPHVIINNGSAPAASPQTCSFPRLNGELYLSGTSFNNAQSATIYHGQTIQLNAVLQRSSEEFPSTTAVVQFYNGSTLIGTAAMTGNYAKISFTPPTAGTYTLKAQYSGSGSYQDPSYGAFPFGSVTVVAN